MFSLEKRGLEGFSSMPIDTCREDAKGMEPGSVRWCPVPGQEAMGTNKHRRLSGNTAGVTALAQAARGAQGLLWESSSSPLDVGLGPCWGWGGTRGTLRSLSASASL